MTTGSGRPDYRRLDVTRVIETARRLERRIDERFPGSGLGEVAGELLLVAEAPSRSTGCAPAPSCSCSGCCR
jgi:hypothetical protein